MGLAAGLLEFVEWDSASRESAGQNKSADGARERTSDGDGGTRPRSKSGRGSAASPDHQSRLRQFRSAARIGAPPRSPRENNGADFSSRRSLVGSASFNHCTDNRLRRECNERRNFRWDGSDRVAAPLSRAAIDASSLKQKLLLKKGGQKIGRPFFWRTSSKLVA
jgi:hypothetical protein